MQPPGATNATMVESTAGQEVKRGESKNDEKLISPCFISWIILISKLDNLRGQDYLKVSMKESHNPQGNATKSTNRNKPQKLRYSGCLVHGTVLRSVVGKSCTVLLYHSLNRLWNLLPLQCISSLEMLRSFGPRLYPFECVLCLCVRPIQLRCNSFAGDISGIKHMWLCQIKGQRVSQWVTCSSTL